MMQGQRWNFVRSRGLSLPVVLGLASMLVTCTGCDAPGGLVWTKPLSVDGGALDTDATIDKERVSCRAGTWIFPDSLTNARDLGGIAVGPSASVACGAIYRSAAPVGLSQQGCSDFWRLGIRTVIDLRTQSESLASPDSACVAQTSSMVPAPMPVPYNVSAADYVADLNATDSVVAVFTVLADESTYPVDIHCVYGRDRTGVMAAVILLALGATADDVMTDYRLSASAGLGAYPGSLSAVLSTIAQRGGIETYLAGAGVDADTLAKVRARLVTSTP
jgi:protein-tyrosine phosphatase